MPFSRPLNILVLIRIHLNYLEILNPNDYSITPRMIHKRATTRFIVDSTITTVGKIDRAQFLNKKGYVANKSLLTKRLAPGFFHFLLNYGAMDTVNYHYPGSIYLYPNEINAALNQGRLRLIL